MTNFICSWLEFCKLKSFKETLSFRKPSSKVETILFYIESLQIFLLVKRVCFFILPFINGFYDLKLILGLKSVTIRIEVIEGYLYYWSSFLYDFNDFIVFFADVRDLLKTSWKFSISTLDWVIYFVLFFNFLRVEYFLISWNANFFKWLTILFCKICVFSKRLFLVLILNLSKSF